MPKRVGRMSRFSARGGDPKPGLKIQNVVATAGFDQTFDVDAIARAFPEAEYRPGVFAGLPFKLKRPKTCTLIFKSGKMVCTGAKSERQVREAILKVAGELRAAGIPVTGKPEIKVQNVVASGALGQRVDIEELCRRSPIDVKVMYEPEQFPGAVYRMEEPKVVFLIFSNGRIVCVGAKKEEEIHQAVENLRRTLQEIGLLRGRQGASQSIDRSAVSL
ncbi:MAG: TATA-box-binding protein [Nitrososphaeria archaeon]